MTETIADLELQRGRMKQKRYPAVIIAAHGGDDARERAADAPNAPYYASGGVQI